MKFFAPLFALAILVGCGEGFSVGGFYGQDLGVEEVIEVTPSLHLKVERKIFNEINLLSLDLDLTFYFFEENSEAPILLKKGKFKVKPYDSKFYLEGAIFPPGKFDATVHVAKGSVLVVEEHPLDKDYRRVYAKILKYPHKEQLNSFTVSSLDSEIEVFWDMQMWLREVLVENL